MKKTKEETARKEYTEENIKEIEAITEKISIINQQRQLLEELDRNQDKSGNLRSILSRYTVKLELLQKAKKYLQVLFRVEELSQEVLKHEEVMLHTIQPHSIDATLVPFMKLVELQLALQHDPAWSNLQEFVSNRVHHLSTNLMERVKKYVYLILSKSELTFTVSTATFSQS